MPRHKGSLVTAAQLAEYNNPLVRKPTFNIQAFADARIITGLFRYFSQHGFSEPKFSALVNLALETLHDVLVRQGKILPEESPTIAIEELRAAGFSMAQLKDHRRSRRLIRHLTAEDMSEGWGTTLDNVCEDNMPHSDVAPSVMDEKEALKAAAKYLLSCGESLTPEMWEQIVAFEKKGVWFDWLVGVERPAEFVQAGVIPSWIDEPNTTMVSAHIRQEAMLAARAQAEADATAHKFEQEVTPTRPSNKTACAVCVKNQVPLVQATQWITDEGICCDQGHLNAPAFVYADSVQCKNLQEYWIKLGLAEPTQSAL